MASGHLHKIITISLAVSSVISHGDQLTILVYYRRLSNSVFTTLFELFELLYRSLARQFYTIQEFRKRKILCSGSSYKRWNVSPLQILAFLNQINIPFGTNDSSHTTIYSPWSRALRFKLVDSACTRRASRHSATHTRSAQLFVKLVSIHYWFDASYYGIGHDLASG